MKISIKELESMVFNGSMNLINQIPLRRGEDPESSTYKERCERRLLKDNETISDISSSKYRIQIDEQFGDHTLAEVVKSLKAGIRL